MADATEKKDTTRNRAYAAAATRLREAHRDEFNTLLAEEYGKFGLTPRRRRTPEEIEAEMVAKAIIREEKAAMKRLQKMAALQAQIDALKEEAELEGLEAALTSVVTADQ